MPTGVVMASATQSGMLCVTRMNSTENGPSGDHVARPHGLQAVAWLDAVLLELGLDQGERQRAWRRPGPSNSGITCGTAPMWSSWPWVRMSGENLVPAGFHVGQVRDDQVHAELVGVREHDSGIDEDRGVLPRHRHHVHAELAEASERDHFQRRRRHLGHCGLSHADTPAANAPMPAWNVHPDCGRLHHATPCSPGRAGRGEVPDGG